MTAGAPRQLVWDWPTRIFHWLLVLLLGFSWWSAENHQLEWHRWSGMAILTLVVFRLLWGLFGTSTARFGEFVKGPGAVWSYLRARSQLPVSIGHNPLGGWSVIVMLVLLVVQVTSGLFSVDVDGIESGPLSHLVDFDQGRTAAEIHEISFNLLLAVVVLHVFAIIFYLIVRRRNLIGPMVTGFQRTAEANANGSTVLVPRWRVLAALLVAVLLASGVWNGFRL